MMESTCIERRIRFWEHRICWPRYTLLLKPPLSCVRRKRPRPRNLWHVVSVLACQATNDEILSGEEEEAFVCDIPGKLLGFPVTNREGLSRGYDALKWKMDIAVTRDITYSSTGIINYHDTKMFTLQGTRSRATRIYPWPFVLTRGMLLREVVHVPGLSYHLFPIRIEVEKRHHYIEKKRTC